MTGLALALALALAAGQPQADEPRILDSAARLTAEVQLQRAVQQGSRRAIQRIPRAAKIAMVVGGAAILYVGYHHVERRLEQEDLDDGGGREHVGARGRAARKGPRGLRPLQPPRGGRGGRQ